MRARSLGEERDEEEEVEIEIEEADEV